MKTVQLVIRPAGNAQLVRGDRVVWDSLEDAEFRDAYPDEQLGEDDLDDIIDYLVGTGALTDEQADSIEAYEESEEGDDEAGEPLEGELVDEYDEDGDGDPDGEVA